MNPEVKALWNAALRSGKYEQTTESLSREGKYCCLGVLCEVAIENGVEVSKEVLEPEQVVMYDGRSTVLPLSVQRWAGLNDPNPLIEFDANPIERIIGIAAVSELNDKYRLTFPELADIFDERL